MNLPRLVLGIIVVLICFSIIFLLLTVNKDNYPSQKRSDKLNIVASFFPLADFAKEIGKDKVVVDILFTQSPEVSSLSTKDLIKLKEADLILINGVNFEVALMDILKSDPSLLTKIVDTSQNVQIIDNDPHIWLDPTKALIQANNITDALSEIDPANSLYYRNNFQNLADKLVSLDNKIYEELKNFSKTDFISFHDAFIYFNKRYNLNKIASIEEFTGKEPTANYLASIIKKIKEHGVKAIFSEPQFSPKIVEAIAKDMNLKVYVLDPIENGDLQKDSYISKMEQNLESLKQAFSLYNE